MSPTAAIVVGLVAGLVAYTAKGWKEVTGFFSFFCFLFIGPRSDHSLLMSVTD